MREDIRKILEPYIGKQVVFDFYEGEEDMDLLDTGKYVKYTLVDIDARWALVRIDKSKKSINKIIRLSGIKGISVP